MAGLLFLSLFLIFTGAAAIEISEAAIPSQRCRYVPYDHKSDAQKTDLGNEGYLSYSRRTHRTSCVKEWTVLIYMNVDHDLRPYSLWDLYEMEASANPLRLKDPKYKSNTASTEVLDILVEQDYAGEKLGRRYHMVESPRPWVRNIREKLNVQKSQFETEGARNETASPIAHKFQSETEFSRSNYHSRLRSFLEWGIQNYPAENYMVILWGHGMGWQKSTTISDETLIDILGVRDAAKHVSEKFLNGSPLDVLVSDSCLMQSIEVASEVSEQFRYVAASQQVQTYLGLPYRRLFLEISSGRYKKKFPLKGIFQGKDAAWNLAYKIPMYMKNSLAATNEASRLTGYQSYYDKEAMGKYTFSSIASDVLRRNLVPSLKKFGQRLYAYLKENPDRASRLAMALRQLPQFIGDARDLGSLTPAIRLHLSEEQRSQFQENEGLPDTFKALHKSIDQVDSDRNETLVNYYVGNDYRRGLGLAGNSVRIGNWTAALRPISIWIPKNQQSYRERISDLRQSWFFMETKKPDRTINRRGEHKFFSLPGWSDWLDLLYGPAEETP